MDNAICSPSFAVAKPILKNLTEGSTWVHVRSEDALKGITFYVVDLRYIHSAYDLVITLDENQESLALEELFDDTHGGRFVLSKSRLQTSYEPLIDRYQNPRFIVSLIETMGDIEPRDEILAFDAMIEALTSESGSTAGCILLGSYTETDEDSAEYLLSDFHRFSVDRADWYHMVYKLVEFG